MPHRLRDLVCVLALVGLPVAACPSSVDAQARHVVLLPLEGRRASTARDAIGAGLRERGLEVDLVEEVPADLGALARSRGADAVLGGTANVRGRNWRVRLFIRDATGADAGAVAMPVRGRGGVPRLLARLAAALERVSPAGSASESSSGVPSGGVESASRTSSPRTPSADTEPASSTSPTSASPNAAGGDGHSSATPDDSDGATDPPIRALVLVGAGVRSRAFELLSPDGLSAAYRAEPYFEVTARAEARFFDVAFVRAGFGTSIGLDSVSSSGSPLADTLFLWLRADAGASVVIDDTVELGAAFGLGWDRYQMQFNEEVPTAEYLHLRPAFVSGFRFAGDALVLDAEIGVRIPFGVGDLESLYGVEHDVFGLDGVARLHGVIDPGFAWAIEAGARQYWLTFRSPGGDITARDSGWHATGYAGWRF